MKHLKKLTALLTVAVMAFSASGLQAADYSSTGGYGYVESRRAPSVAPAIALGVIAAVAIVAIAIQNSSSGHGHAH